MRKVKCFETVEELIIEGSKQFGPLYRVNEEDVKILAQYCHCLDLLCDEFDGETYEIEIDDIKLTIQIAMECHKINCNHRYLKVLKERSLNFDLELLPEESLFRLTFVFPPVWDRIDPRELLKKFLREEL